MEARFDCEAAAKLGVNAAILMQIIAEHYNMSTKLSPGHESGLTASLDLLHALCPYLSVHQIRSAIAALEEGAYIYKTQENSSDRTITYWPTPEGCKLVHIEQHVITPLDSSLPRPAPARRKKPQYDKDSNPYRGAKYLDDEVHKNFPSLPPTPEKQLQQWADCFRLLREQDHYSYEMIYRAMNFGLQDPFWKMNIRSAGALRKHMQDLIVRMPNNNNYADDS